MTTSLLYTGWVGFALTSIAGPFYWTPPDLQGWIMLLVAGVFGVIGHMLLIKALEAAPASVLQPFNYTLLVWATVVRSEEHTSELQSLMRISYAVFCLKKKKLINY